MNQELRETVIGESGRATADLIQELRAMIGELHEYLNVTRIAQTNGFKLVIVEKKHD